MSNVNKYVFKIEDTEFSGLVLFKVQNERLGLTVYMEKSATIGLLLHQK